MGKPRFKIQHPLQLVIRDRGYLPHWQSVGGIYFVTFRLADSMPVEVAERLIRDRERALEAMRDKMGKPPSPEVNRIREAFALKYDEHLDRGDGSCILKNHWAAKAVADCLVSLGNDCLRLYAWCVMPNHVHTVFQPLNDNSLPEIMQRLKGRTAREINQLLGRSGRLWQAEYYDHLVRDERDLEVKVNYVLENPSRAGLEEWRWVGCLEDAD